MPFARDFDGTSLLLSSRCKLWSRLKPSPELCESLQTLLDAPHSMRAARKEEPWGDSRAFRRAFARIRRQAGLPGDLTFGALRSSGFLTFRQFGMMPACPPRRSSASGAAPARFASSGAAGPGAAAPSAYGSLQAALAKAWAPGTLISTRAGITAGDFRAPLGRSLPSGAAVLGSACLPSRFRLSGADGRSWSRAYAPPANRLASSILGRADDVAMVSSLSRRPGGPPAAVSVARNIEPERVRLLRLEIVTEGKPPCCAHHKPANDPYPAGTAS